MADEIVNTARAHRFELAVDGHTAKAWYRLAPGIITFTHTDVPKELEGRGIGSRLARAGLDHARAEGLKVVPLCPFVAAWIGKHPEYADLVIAAPANT
ncbi:GNAT family N-acetyltransferase [soil metagenome]